MAVVMVMIEIVIMVDMVSLNFCNDIGVIEVLLLSLLLKHFEDGQKYHCTGKKLRSKKDLKKLLVMP